MTEAVAAALTWVVLIRDLIRGMQYDDEGLVLADVLAAMDVLLKPVQRLLEDA